MAIPDYITIGQGPPLVLLMGLGADAKAWEPHWTSWSLSHTCIAVNNQGTPRTPLRAAELTTRALAEDVVDLIENLDLGPCDIAGISMGAGIAQHVSIQRPDLVRRLVLTAPWAQCDRATRSILHVLDQIGQSGGPHVLAEQLRNLVWTPDWINTHPETDPVHDLKPGVTMKTEAFSAQIRACATHDTVNQLPQIVAPTLVTYGARDIFIRGQLAWEVAAGIPEAVTAVFDTGHVHHWEELDRYNQLVSEWFS